MRNLKFTVNASQIAETFGDLKEEIEQAITDGVQQVASMTYGKAQELASENLGSTRQIYMDALSYEEVEPGLWVVSLDESAMWIEENRKAGDMTQDLLRRNFKVAKDGSRYKAIPFDQATTPSRTPSRNVDLVSQVKRELRSRNIPYKKLEYNKDGSPRVGRLHTINDISSRKPSPRASSGALSGLTIYQRMTSSGSVRRDIMTFRVVSSKHRGTKWIHPGSVGRKFLDQALDWAAQAFDEEILPAIMEKFGR